MLCSSTSSLAVAWNRRHRRTCRSRATASMLAGRARTALLDGRKARSGEIDTMNKMTTYDFKLGVRSTATRLSGQTRGFVRRAGADGTVTEIPDYMAANASSIGQFASLPHTWCVASGEGELDYHDGLESGDGELGYHERLEGRDGVLDHHPANLETRGGSECASNKDARPSNRRRRGIQTVDGCTRTGSDH